MTTTATPALGRYGPIEVFRAGTFKDMSGNTQSFSDETLRQIASDYDRDLAPAPVVIGHPQTDTPAYGWVERLYVQDGVLNATLEDTVSEFADMVKAGRYKKVSISLFSPSSQNNPKPGGVYMKHVGFLGATAPAVAGLKPVRFSSHPGDAIEMVQDNPSYAEFASRDELSRLLLQLREQEVEKLIDEGRVLPAFKDEVIAFATSLDDSESLSFAEGQTSTRKDWFMSYLKRQPQVVSFGGMDLGDDPFDPNALRSRGSGQSVPDGYKVDPANSELFEKATRIAAEKGLYFAEAVDIALSGK